ncbi:MAG: YXWGXW repeat-containing protein [Bryobacteraceae bacterium]
MRIARKASKLLIAATTLAVLFCGLPAPSRAGVFVSISVAPPVLPVYIQPPCPVDGYLWTPGYWAWGVDGYYWVPGVWVAPPAVGLLWTPGYWGFGGGIYAWHAGYWGPHVGFYGGVNYGWGYSGFGFGGGIWSGGIFRYNAAVVNVNRTVIRNTYVDRTVIHNTTVVNRTSFNGPGGIQARPTAEQQRFMSERHVAATSAQFSHQRTASQDRSFLASANHGRPPVGAMDRVGGQRFEPQHSFAANRPAVASSRPTEGQSRAPQANAYRNSPNAYRNEPARAPAARPENNSRAEQRPAAQEHENGGHPAPHHGEEHPH